MKRKAEKIERESKGKSKKKKKERKNSYDMGQCVGPRFFRFFG